MKVTQSIRHDEYRWGMHFSLRFFLFFWMLIFPGAILTVKLDFTKKRFRVASFVSSHISTITAIVLSDNCVSSRRDYEEIRDHSAEKRRTRGLCSCRSTTNKCLTYLPSILSKPKCNHNPIDVGTAMLLLLYTRDYNTSLLYL
jgi:hypothetical protein